tara:strand:+ start:16 stop:720 length:705 start_codon:yes stop_codon:yes gene_type:complete
MATTKATTLAHNIAHSGVTSAVLSAKAPLSAPDFTGIVQADDIQETTTDNGVKIEGTVFKDSEIQEGGSGLVTIRTGGGSGDGFKVVDNGGINRFFVDGQNGKITTGTFAGTIDGTATFPNKNFFISAYVTFDGGSNTNNNGAQTISDSLNVTSVTRKNTDVGKFIVNLSITMANSNYVIIGSANGLGSDGAIAQYDSNVSTIGTGSFGIRVRNAVNGAMQNVGYTTVIVIGDR